MNKSHYCVSVQSQSRYYERGYNPIAKLSEIIDSYSKRYTNTAPTHRIDKDIQSKIETGYPGKSQCTEIGYWRPNSYLTVHRTAIHFLGKYTGSLKTNIPNVGCLVNGDSPDGFTEQISSRSNNIPPWH